ncbi:MAG TPA: response regulator [Desulfobacterales bacterium]|nr:response regulator [Desulfobacterales bacterium]HIP40742.1 response regulator [Desulfocapsa sulfexigens]
MTDLPTASNHNETTPTSNYLDPGESIVLVDDSQEILLIFESLLTSEGFTVFTASNAKELYQILERERVALILLDIGLPDRDGTEVLTDIVPLYPDLGIIMLTGTTDLKVALGCLRQGADDYLAKPVKIEEFSLAIRRTLQKRRLTIDNRNYQKQLELSNYRARFLHQLNLKMNTAYLNSIELDTVLQSILVGITAEEGLKFNRAFLLLFNETGTELQGKMAIGPPCRADAGKIWNSIKQDNLHLGDILNNIKTSCMTDDTELNITVKELIVAADDHDHILIRACRNRSSIHVQNGFAGNQPATSQLLTALQEDTFIITPLFSPDKSLGVIIADNFVTTQPISTDDINSLEIFANQASLAIEHSHLYQTMLNKITELENVTQELEKNKDLLIAAERYSVLGHMSAQLVHAIRNPITSIGGIARLLAKKSTDEKNLKFLDMMIMESSKIESTLDDLFSFVSDHKPNKHNQPLYPLIRKSIMLFYGSMKKQSIAYHPNLPPPEPELFIDAKLIKQMLLHLIKNALEAMPDGGTLSISCREEKDNVLISIKDSGNEIGESNINRVTDPFFTTKTYGTGMGLTLVEKIIAEHQGKFALKYNDDGGMTAQIILPKNLNP